MRTPLLVKDPQLALRIGCLVAFAITSGDNQKASVASHPTEVIGQRRTVIAFRGEC
jgi:hypothetical protein